MDAQTAPAVLHRQIPARTVTEELFIILPEQSQEIIAAHRTATPMSAITPQVLRNITAQAVVGLIRIAFAATVAQEENAPRQLQIHAPTATGVLTTI